MLHFVAFLNLFICTQIFYKYSSMILFACLGFCLLAALMGIINDIHHQKVCKSSLKLMHVTVLGVGDTPHCFMCTGVMCLAYVILSSLKMMPKKVNSRKQKKMYTSTSYLT